MAKCKKCGKQTMLMSGTAYLNPDQEPYESGKEEGSRTGIEEIEYCVSVQFCENCNEVAEVWEE